MNNNIRLMGLDPGSNHCGIGILDYDFITGQITYATALTLDAEKLSSPLSEDLLESHNARYVKSYHMGVRLGELLRYYQPHLVCSEVPFYHRLHPGAFAPLVEVVYALRTSVAQYDPNLPFVTYEPLVIKKTATGKAFADKNLMRECLSQRSEITSVMDIPVTQISEHAVDALSVALTHYILTRST